MSESIPSSYSHDVPSVRTCLPHETTTTDDSHISKAAASYNRQDIPRPHQGFPFFPCFPLSLWHGPWLVSTSDLRIEFLALPQAHAGCLRPVDFASAATMTTQSSKTTADQIMNTTEKATQMSYWNHFV